MDLTSKPTDRVQNVINNHVREGATDKPLYREAIDEMARRSDEGTPFDIRRTVDFLLGIARQGEVCTYIEIMDNYELDWAKHRYKLTTHLDNIIGYCVAHGLPMVSVLVVGKDGIANQQLPDSSLKGFCKGLENHGITTPTDIDEMRALALKYRNECWAIT
jgi:hypothetical protein